MDGQPGWRFCDKCFLGEASTEIPTPLEKAVGAIGENSRRLSQPDYIRGPICVPLAGVIDRSSQIPTFRTV